MEGLLNTAALLIDDKDTQLVVRTALECAGFHCEVYTSTEVLLRGTKRKDHGLVLVDTDAAATDCAALVSWRGNWLNPDVLLIAIGADEPLVAARALNVGVDDFVAKPVRGAELLARLAAATRRRHPGDDSDDVSVAGCSIDRGASSIVSASSRVTLTAREMALAQVLFESAGRVVTRERLARDVWGLDVSLSCRSIDQHIYQLRRKLKRCAGEALALRGVYGNGYRIDVTRPRAGKAEDVVVSAAMP
jgi:DNA-binding response OmpR family regulator